MSQFDITENQRFELILFEILHHPMLINEYFYFKM